MGTATIVQISNYSASSYGQTGFFNLGIATSLEEEKIWIQTC